jgi:hypothetical protein
LIKWELQEAIERVEKAKSSFRNAASVEDGDDDSNNGEDDGDGRIAKRARKN